MGYFSTWTERVEGAVRLLAPYGFMIVLFVFGTISFSFPVAGAIKAPLILMAIYYWSIYRPTLIPPWLAFAAGMLTDFIGVLPLGMTAIVFVVVRLIITDQRRFLMGQSFIVVWLGFLIISTGAGLVQWLIFGLLNSGFTPFKSQIFSIGFGAALFPAIYSLMHLTHKFLPASGSSFFSKAKN